MKKLFAALIIILATLLRYQMALGYDDVIAHPAITEYAVKNSVLTNYLSRYLGPGFAQDYESMIDAKSVKSWIMAGSTAEDADPCQRANHMHNPLLPWDQSYMSDDPWWTSACLTFWYERYSNVTWATGFLAPAPYGQKASYHSPAPQNWDVARSNYYLALTSDLYRTLYFTKTFNAIGQVLHLLQDMAVPAHTRNDFASHLMRKGNPYEYYVQDNSGLVTDMKETPSFSNIKLTDFWDTDQYNGSNPSTFTNIGLAEFVNANYFSDYTISNNGTTPEHTFPYPHLGSANANGPSYQICSYQLFPGTTVQYISRKSKGTCPPDLASADHFAVVSLMNPSGYSDVNPYAYYWLDDNVHNTYAKELLPRAVGYSAALLDYFFRGTIEISLPDDGIYAITGPDGKFNKIILKARNTTASGETMTNGTIQLIVKYRTATTYPFQTYTDCVQRSSSFSRIVASEAGNTTSLLATAKTLTFNLPNPGIPLDATDVYLQVVYKGQLGNESNAVAVGFKDISEPTPVDIMNSMDYVCTNAGNVPKTNPATLMNVYMAFSAQAASSTNYSAKFTSIPPGKYGRVFVLVDGENGFHYSSHSDGDQDSPVYSSVGADIQTDIVNGQARCTYPIYETERGLAWSELIIYENTSNYVCPPVSVPVTGPVSVQITR